MGGRAPLAPAGDGPAFKVYTEAAAAVKVT